MTRGLIGFTGLVLCVVVVTAAFGQQSHQPRKSFTQRMAEMRRSLAGDEESPPNEQFQDPQQEGDSLLPSWLGGGNQKKPNSAPSPRQNPGVARQMNGQQRIRSDQPTQGVAQRRANANQNVSAGQNSAAKRSPPASGFTLPGLGGAPLPTADRMAAQRTNNHSNAPSPDAQGLESDPDYPVIRETAPESPPATSGTASIDSPRHSPTPRMSSNADAQNVRRELSGSSSTSAPSIAPVPSSPPRRAITRSGEEAARKAAEAFGVPVNDPPTIGASDFIRSPRTHTLPALPSAARSKEAFGEAPQAASVGDPNVLVSQQTPIISSDIRGPKQIIIGRESVYRVRLQNQGTVGAEGIVATVRVPASAEIVGTSATNGSLQPAVADGASTKLEWQLSGLSARGSETLDIRLVPKEGRPLELGVDWTLAPVGSRAVVEVQEPQLKIDIGGPAEVMYDKPQMFRLTLSNPGTGPAEKVRIELIPPGGLDENATSHEFGDLAAGESRSVDIELTPRESGKLVMKAKAEAEGGLASDVTKEIFCRKPELEVDWRGPATKYAGTPATYFFRVRNPGTAPAEDVTVRIELPKATEFTGGSEGPRFDKDRGEVTWRVGTLNPGDDNYMELKCIVNAPGANQLKITASNAAGDITSSSVAETIVEALADLKLTVSDPSGPVAVGSQALYEIHVENRGADTARDVNIIALFSEGIEPDQSDNYSVTDGRVTFESIKELPAGKDVKLRVRARASQPGTHVFRAEVLCSASEIKLAAEETTRFYADEVAHDSEESAEQTANRDGAETTVR